MLWNKKHKYLELPYIKEAEPEAAVNIVKDELFGPDRIYLDDKRRIGKKDKTKNLPDGYLLDLTNNVNPKLYVVENDNRLLLSSDLHERRHRNACLIDVRGK